MGRTPITRDRLKAGEVVMHGIEKLKPEGPGLPDTDVCRPLKESAPTVRQSIEEWLRQSLAAKKAREARMEEMRLFIESTRDDRERRLREQAEAWERKRPCWKIGWKFWASRWRRRERCSKRKRSRREGFSSLRNARGKRWTGMRRLR